MKKHSKILLFCMLNYAVQIMAQSSFCPTCKEYPYRAQISEPFELDYSNILKLKITIPPYPGNLADGEYILYYMNGEDDTKNQAKDRIAARFFIQNNAPEGKAFFYHYLQDSLQPKPLLVISGNFSNGLRQGRWELTNYSQFGEPVESGYCVFDQGLLNGEFYYNSVENGVYKGNYKNNQKQGVWYFPKSTFQYIEDRLNGMQYDTIGIFVLEGLFDNDQPMGEVIVRNRYYGNIEAKITPSSKQQFYSRNNSAPEKYQILNVDPLLNELLTNSVFKYTVNLKNADNINIINTSSGEEVNVNLKDTLLVWDYTNFLYSKTYKYKDSVGKEKTFQYQAEVTENAEGKLITQHFNNKLVADYQTDEVGKLMWKTVYESNFLLGTDWKSFQIPNSGYGYFGYFFMQDTVFSNRKYFLTNALVEAEKTPYSMLLEEKTYTEVAKLKKEFKELFLTETGFIGLTTNVLKNGNTSRTDNFVMDNTEHKLQFETIAAFNLDTNFTIKTNTEILPIKKENLIKSEIKSTLEDYSYLYFPYGNQDFEEGVFCYKGNPFSGTLLLIDTAIMEDSYNEGLDEKFYKIEKTATGFKAVSPVFVYPGKERIMGDMSAHSSLSLNTYVNGKKHGLQVTFREIGDDSFGLKEFEEVGTVAKKKTVIEMQRNNFYDEHAEYRDLLLNIQQFEKGKLNGKQGFVVFGQKGVEKGFRDLCKADLQTLSLKARQMAKNSTKNMTTTSVFNKGIIKDGKIIGYGVNSTAELNKKGNKINDEIILKDLSGNVTAKLLLDENGNGYLRNYATRTKTHNVYLYSQMSFRNFKTTGEFLQYFENGNLAEKHFGMEKQNVELRVKHSDSFYEVIYPKSKYNIDLQLLYIHYYNGEKYFESLPSFFTNYEAQQNADSSFYFNKSGVLIAKVMNNKLNLSKEEWYFYSQGKPWTRLHYSYDFVGTETLEKYEYFDLSGNLVLEGIGFQGGSLMDCDASTSMPLIVPKDITIKTNMDKTKINDDEYVYLRILQPNGKLYAEGWYNTSKQEKDSIWRFYNSAGALEAIGKYKNDEKNGRWLSGDLTGINHLENFCNATADSAMLQSMMKDLDISIEYYVNGDQKLSEYLRTNTEGIERDQYQKVIYWFIPADAKNNEEHKAVSKKAPAKVFEYLREGCMY